MRVFVSDIIRFYARRNNQLIVGLFIIV